MASLIARLFFFLTVVLTPLASVSQVLVKGLPEAEAKAKASRLAASFRSTVFTDANGVRMPYRYFEPPMVGSAADKVPVILYLHGEEEAGSDNDAQVSETECATVWIEPDHLAQHPVYVLAPQLPKGSKWTEPAFYTRTLALLRQFVASHPQADPNRLYLVGFSMGANGVYNMLLKNPNLFAAAMPISGSADAYLGETEAWAALKSTPVIIVHSYDDRAVPVSAALNAAAALQAGGNTFLGYGAPTPALWSPGSTPTPHDAWYTAFEKFEVIYNSLFLGDLSKTHNGRIDITETYTSRKLGESITQVWDYALGTSFVIEGSDKAVMIDATMGHGSLYRYVRENVLVNKDLPIEVFVTHLHQDHTLGLISFIGSPQLRKIYAGRPDDQTVRQLMGADGAKVVAVQDGDLIPLGGSHVEVIAVPGHTAGSIVLKYGRYLFSGDSIGTGYVGVGALSIEQYIGSVQHLLDRMGTDKYIVYGGHTGELRGLMTEQYVHDLLACAHGIVDGSIAAPIYWRGRDSSTRKVSSFGGASMTYALANVYRIPAALGALRISQGTLYPGYAPEFSPTAANTPGFTPSTQYYSAWIGPTTSSMTITAAVMDVKGSSLTINGSNVASGQAYVAALTSSRNNFSLAVRSADGVSRIYTLTIFKATQP